MMRKFFRGERTAISELCWTSDGNVTVVSRKRVENWIYSLRRCEMYLKIRNLETFKSIAYSKTLTLCLSSPISVPHLASNHFMSADPRVGGPLSKVSSSVLKNLWGVILSRIYPIWSGLPVLTNNLCPMWDMIYRILHVSIASSSKWRLMSSSVIWAIPLWY